jgi:hypothetical protein
MKLQRADGDRIFILMTGNAAAIETKVRNLEERSDEQGMRFS